MSATYEVDGAVYLDGDDCFRCNNAPAETRGLHCTACRIKIEEDGRADFPLADGDYEPIGYRRDMLNAGRWHLL